MPPQSLTTEISALTSEISNPTVSLAVRPSSPEKQASTTAEPKVEEPKVEPKVAEPKVEEPKAEESKADEKPQTTTTEDPPKIRRIIDEEGGTTDASVSPPSPSPSHQLTITVPALPPHLGKKDPIPTTPNRY
jgi:hypothetical protein